MSYIIYTTQTKYVVLFTLLQTHGRQEVITWVQFWSNSHMKSSIRIYQEKNILIRVTPSQRIFEGVRGVVV